MKVGHIARIVSSQVCRWRCIDGAAKGKNDGLWFRVASKVASCGHTLRLITASQHYTEVWKWLNTRCDLQSRKQRRIVWPHLKPYNRITTLHRSEVQLKFQLYFLKIAYFAEFEEMDSKKFKDLFIRSQYLPVLRGPLRVMAVAQNQTLPTF